MVCSCAISSYCVNWLQITFCSCVNETVLFSFLQSLLRENGRSLRLPKIFIKKQTRWSNGKKTFELGYRKISRFVSVSQINYLHQPSASHWQIRIFFLTFSSRKAFISNERVCQTCTQVMALVSIQTGCAVASVDWYPKFDFINWVDHWFDICDITLNF